MDAATATQVVTDLYECWYSAMVRFAARSLRGTGLAEETVQQAFMELYKQLRRGTRIDHPRAWVMRVVRRGIWRQFEAHPDGQLEHEPLDAAERIPSGRLNHEDAGELAILLSCLSPREEEAVLLRASGLGYSEIAAELGLATGTVGTLLSRALRKMQEAAQGRPAARRITHDRP